MLLVIYFRYTNISYSSLFVVYIIYIFIYLLFIMFMTYALEHEFEFIPLSGNL